MAEPIPEVHAINAALLDIEGAGQLARAMDVGLLAERQARTAGEPRLAPDGRAQPLMFGTVECWDAIVCGDRRGFGKRGGGRRRGRSWGSAEAGEPTPTRAEAPVTAAQTTTTIAAPTTTARARRTPLKKDRPSTVPTTRRVTTTLQTRVQQPAARARNPSRPRR